MADDLDIKCPYDDAPRRIAFARGVQEAGKALERRLDFIRGAAPTPGPPLRPACPHCGASITRVNGAPHTYGDPCGACGKPVFEYKMIS